MCCVRGETACPGASGRYCGGVKLLFIADIVGQPGRRAVKELVPRLRQAHGLSLVIGNGENAAGGSGITVNTAEEIFAAGVDIILYCCGAYRAMNAAALKVYETIRSEGTQKSAVPLMQSRADLYKYLDYHSYEQKLDELFAKGKG